MLTAPTGCRLVGLQLATECVQVSGRAQCMVEDCEVCRDEALARKLWVQGCAYMHDEYPMGGEPCPPSRIPNSVGFSDSMETMFLDILV